MTILSCGNKNLRTLHFAWFFTDWCNYECSYCCVKDKMAKSFSKETSPAKYKLVLTRLGLLKTDFTIELVGGEPTLHPYLAEVLETLTAMEQCKRIELTTNLSRPIAYFEKLNEEKYNKTTVIASYHPEYYTQEFVDKAIAITNMQHLTFQSNVNLSDDPKDWDALKDLIAQFEEHKVDYVFNFLFSTGYRPIVYNEEFYNTFKTYIRKIYTKTYEYTFEDGTRHITEDELVKNDYRKFKGYKCVPLMYQIETDGSIYNFCTKTKAPLSMNVDDLIKQDICPREECTCEPMYTYYKEKA